MTTPTLRERLDRAAAVRSLGPIAFLRVASRPRLVVFLDEAHVGGLRDGRLEVFATADLRLDWSDAQSFRPPRLVLRLVAAGRHLDALRFLGEVRASFGGTLVPSRLEDFYALGVRDVTMTTVRPDRAAHLDKFVGRISDGVDPPLEDLSWVRPRGPRISTGPSRGPAHFARMFTSVAEVVLTHGRRRQ